MNEDDEFYCPHCEVLWDYCLCSDEVYVAHMEADLGECEYCQSLGEDCEGEHFPDD